MYGQGNWTRLTRKLFSLPHTYFLLLGTGLGYLGLLLWVGIRLIPILLGALIVLLMILAWIWQIHKMRGLIADNLLETEIFSDKLAEVTQKLAGRSPANWQETFNWAKESQVFAHRIARKESVLTPELLETLYTVIALLDQVIEAHLALEQVETDTYKQLTENHLKASRKQLKNTYSQLQHLQDQVLLSALESTEVKAGLPGHLRSLISENKTTLQTLINENQEEL
jgi:hypothetical protein